MQCFAVMIVSNDNYGLQTGCFSTEQGNLTSVFGIISKCLNPQLVYTASEQPITKPWTQTTSPTNTHFSPAPEQTNLTSKSV